MNTLPFNLVPLSENRRQFHRNWLRERRLDLELSAGQTNEWPDDVIDVDWEAEFSPCDKFVRERQIRLLDHEITNNSISGRYVAILELNEELGTCLCLPFSRYSDPATKDEWRTPYDSSPLKVLQFWNANEISTPVLAHHSWAIFSINAASFRQMQVIHQATLSGSWLPLELRDQTGTPIFTSDDERLVYQQEERAVFCAFAEILDQHLRALEQWRQPSRNIFAESCQWARPEAMAASGSKIKRRVHIELAAGQVWDGVAVQIDEYFEGDEFEIRWKIENPPEALVPGIPVVIGTPNNQFQTLTRGQGDLVIYRTKDQTLWEQLKDRRWKEIVLFAKLDEG